MEFEFADPRRWSSAAEETDEGPSITSLDYDAQVLKEYVEAARATTKQRGRASTSTKKKPKRS
jgi:hypothetical protein